MSEKNNYRQVLTPDFSKITEILLSAKGGERTMIQFSQDSGVNASTLSRLANGKLKRPLTLELIDAIMDHKSPSCNISKDELIRANGMIDGETYELHYHNERPYDKLRIRQERLIRMKSIITNELYARGVGYRKLTRDETEYVSSIDRNSTIKTGLLLKMLETENEPFWCLLFNTKTFGPEDEDAASKERINVTIGSMQHRMITYYASIFLQDAWEPETMTDLKCSFVFCDERVYDAFRNRLEKARLSSNMTTILLDTDTGIVIREESVPGCQKSDKDHYFDIPVREDEESAYTDEFLFDALDE